MATPIVACLPSNRGTATSPQLATKLKHALDTPEKQNCQHLTVLLFMCITNSSATNRAAAASLRRPSGWQVKLGDAKGPGGISAGQTEAAPLVMPLGRRSHAIVKVKAIRQRRSEHPKGRRVPAGDIEGLVLDRLRALFASGGEISDAIAPLGLDAATQRAVLDRSAKLAERWTKLASLELRELVHSLVQQIQIDEAQILVWLNRTAIVLSVMPDAPPKPADYVPTIEPFVLSITASLRRAGKGVRLVIGNGAAKAIDDGLASLIARAIATRNMLLAGRDDSIDAMALRLGVRRDYVAVLVRLSYLSPEIVRAILVGQHPIELTPTRLVALSRNLPHDWQEQRRLLGFAPA
jgi:site-specific DNA recombinase